VRNAPGAGRPAPGGGRPAAPKQPDIPLTPEELARQQQRAQERRGSTVGAAGAKAGAKKKPKKAERARVLEETMRRDAAAMVKEFQSGTGGVVKRKKKKRNPGDIDTDDRQGGTIEVQDNMTVEQLANAMEVGVSDLILALMDNEIMATKNETLSFDAIRKLAARFHYEVTLEIPEEEEVLVEEEDDPADVVLRAPVITVMGHVDHGKTSFLDVVRKASVAKGEAGGITQHIAAYDVKIPSGRVVFLDTPGHAAFTEMRARGSQVTDVVVLMVAADDGIRPQTIEAIDHAKAAGVPIVVAINKCDKPEAQPDRVRQELTQYGLLTEEWGGNTQMQNISCHTEEGIPELLELLGLESEMLELRANPKRVARGAVIESELTKSVGPTAWVLVQNGTLRVGDAFLCGTTYGRVRAMYNSGGQLLEEAGPSTPVLVTGLTEPASAGDAFFVMKEERVARAIAQKRENIAKLKQGSGAKHMTLEDFHARMSGVDQKVLNVIVKADVQGSVDVLKSSLEKLGNEEVSLNIVHSGVGGVNESDVMLASASDAVVIAFHVAANPKIQKLAENEGVEIRSYRVIYEMMDQIRSALEGMLTPDKKETVTGHTEIRKVFRSSNVGNIAGCYQLDGEAERGSLCRIIRDDVVKGETKIQTIRREKDEVKTIATGYECGIRLDNFEDIQVGDIIECFKVENVAKTLD
jgi:translation initiation factor IF-2